jgi:carboxymethylenebutenolidase
VSFHGTKIGLDLDKAQSVSCPLQIHVGDVDPQIPLDEVERTRAALAGKKDVGIFIYPGAAHGFTGHGRPSYHLLADSMSRAGALALMASLG